MKTEQFIYGLFKNYGIKLRKSPGLTKLLNGDIIDYLCQLKENKECLWPNGVVTVTEIHNTTDEYGRSGVRNHTFAFTILDYLAYMQPRKLLQPYFITEIEKPPQNLESLQIGE